MLYLAAAILFGSTVTEEGSKLGVGQIMALQRRTSFSARAYIGHVVVYTTTWCLVYTCAVMKHHVGTALFSLVCAMATWQDAASHACTLWQTLAHMEQTPEPSTRWQVWQWYQCWCRNSFWVTVKVQSLLLRDTASYEEGGRERGR